MNRKFLYPSERILTWISITCITMSLLTMLPVAWAISLALKSDSETIGGTFLPETPQWGNFKLAWEQYGMAQFFRNSIFVTFFSVLLTTVAGFIAAYAFTKLKFKGSESIYKAFLVVIIIPPAALVIPLLIELNTLHLYNSHIGLAIAYSAMGLPLAILIFRGFMSRFSSEIIEAARIDGCRESQIIRRVLMPLSKGPISTVVIVLFLANWNEFILSLVLIRDSEKYTLPVGLTSQIGQFRSQFNLISAASLIAAIPIFMLYLLLQRNFQQGMSEGALRA